MRAWLRIYWRRVLAGAAIGTVAVVTGRISYTHIYELSLSLHQHVLAARLYAFGIDGMIVIGSVVLLDRTADRWLGWVGVVPGVLISVYANWESGIRYGWQSALWATVPAVTFALSTFILERWVMAQVSQRPALAAALAAAAEPARAPEPATKPARAPEPGSKPDLAARLRADGLDVKQIAAQMGISERTAYKHLAAS
jgi:hypothetical protein